MLLLYPIIKEKTVWLSSYEESLSDKTPVFDAVTAWTVIEHILNPEDFLRRCYQALKPQGILLLEFPTVDRLLYEQLENGFFWVMPPYPQVLNPATKLYILRRGTTRLSQWTKFHSCRIKICIYRNLSTNLLPYIRGAFNSCNIK